MGHSVVSTQTSPVSLGQVRSVLANKETGVWNDEVNVKARGKTECALYGNSARVLTGHGTCFFRSINQSRASVQYVWTDVKRARQALGG